MISFHYRDDEWNDTNGTGSEIPLKIAVILIPQLATIDPFDIHYHQNRQPTQAV